MGERPEERSNLEKAGLEYRRVVRALGKSQDIGKFFPLEWQCDLLFIDGDHRRPGIDDDINAWADTVKHGGYIVFHDYIPNPPQHIKGRVAEAVDEWKVNAVGFNYCRQESIVDRLLTFRLT
jgi:predicted O-methyltransferase YrrM